MSHAQFFLLSKQNPGCNDGVGGIWAAPGASVGSGTATFGTPTACAGTLAEGLIIRDLGSKYSTGTYAGVSCAGSPQVCTVTGAATAWTSISGFVGTHTTFNNGNPKNPILTTNLAFCAIPAGNYTDNDNFDFCVPITTGVDDTTLTINTRAVGTEGSTTGWPWPQSGAYAIYHASWPLGVNQTTGTINAGDLSGLNPAHNWDQVMAYNGDFEPIQIQMYKSIGRNYGGPIQVNDLSNSAAPGWAFGANFVGSLGHVISSAASGTRAPVSQNLMEGWEPSLGFSFIDDYDTTANTVPLWSSTFSDGVHRTDIAIDKNVAATDSWQLANGGLDIDQAGDGTFAGSLSSLSGGFGPFSNFALDSEFQLGSAYWSNGIGQPAASIIANNAADPWGKTTAETFTAPTLTTGQYAGQIQTTTTTSVPNGVYSCSIWASNSSGAYFVIALFGPSYTQSPPTAGALHLTSTLTKYTVTGQATSAAPIQFEWITYTSGAVINVSQVQCQSGSTTGTQVITGSYPVSGNGLVIDGNPFTLTTNGSSGAASFDGATLNIPQYSGGGMTWPGAAGIANYGGSSAWATSYNASNLIPANFISTLNQSTTGTAAGLSGTCTANFFFAAPNGSSGTLTCRGIVAADVPTLNQNTTGTAAGLSGSQTANFFYAAPNGSGGTGAWRAIVAADIPTLNQNTTGSAGSVALSGVTGLGTGVATALGINGGSAGAAGILIATGTAAMGTSAISSGACATVVTVAASGVATTDMIETGFNGDPTAVTGYGASATGAVVTIYPYPSSGDVNFKVCNSTANSITPGSLTLNWKVYR